MLHLKPGNQNSLGETANRVTFAGASAIHTRENKAIRENSLVVGK
jgi:hypothetical protein